MVCSSPHLPRERERSEKMVETIDPKNVVHSPSTARHWNATLATTAAAGVINKRACRRGGGSGRKTTTPARKRIRMHRDCARKPRSRPSTTWRSTPTGYPVLFPRSRFIQEYKLIKNSEKGPIRPFCGLHRRATSPQARGYQKLWAHNGRAVTVSDYADSLPISGSAPLAAAAPMSLMLTDHAKEIALGALALVSLFMVSNMVKKGSPTPAPAMATAGGIGMGMAPRSPSPLPGREEAVGEAMEGDRCSTAWNWTNQQGARCQSGFRAGRRKSRRGQSGQAVDESVVIELEKHLWRNYRE
jgi:hypothetical protein